MIATTQPARGDLQATAARSVAPAQQAAVRQEASVSKGPIQIPSLDGIRAVAVLVVFLSHAGLRTFVPGNFGVTIFFFLSGYLITTLMRIELQETGGVSFRLFYLRRTLRILPPFYIVLAAGAVVTSLGALEGSIHLDSLFFQATHLTNYYILIEGWWDGRTPGSWIFWSLAVEEHFYMVFPLLYMVLRRLLPSARHQMLALFGLCAAVLAWRCVLIFGFHVHPDRTYLATDTRIDSILFGCILAVWANPMLDHFQVSRMPSALRRLSSEIRLKALWLPLGLLGLLASFLVRDPQIQETFRYTLQGLSLFPVFIVAIRYPAWGAFRLLNVGWIKFVGVLSYTLYLVHPTVLYGFDQWTRWPIALQGVLAGSMSLLIAVAMYHFVEKPCARLRKRLSPLVTRRLSPVETAKPIAEPRAEPALPAPALTTDLLANNN
jgi:peptidoglycan/LPS O-acetylase OafA/YrhL